MGSKKHKKESKKKKHRSRSRSPLDGEERERKRHKKHKDRKKDRSPDVEEVPVDSHLAREEPPQAEPPRDRSASKERDRRMREQRRHDREKEERRESAPTRLSPPATSGAGQDSLSVEETNRLRAKLGLKPLEVNEKPAEDGKLKDDLGEFYHKPAANIAQQQKTEKLRQKLEERKEKRKLEQKLKTKTLGEESEEDDATAWVQRSRLLDKQKQDAAKRAAMLDEMDEVFGVSALVAEEEQAVRGAAYTASSLRGLRVAHDLHTLGEERETILTLADKPVLAEDAEDVLVNVNMQDDERYMKNMAERKKAKSGYRAYDEEAEIAASLGLQRPVLAKYDDEIDPQREHRARGFTIGDEDAVDAQRFREMMRQERLQGGVEKRLESLQLPALQLAADYMDEYEMQAKFKKPKKRGKMRKKPKQEPIDVEEYEGDAAPLDTDDTDVKPSQLRAAEQDEDETEPDTELQAALARARRLRQADLTVRTLPKVEEILEAVATDPLEEEAQRAAGMTLDATAEFCRTLGDIPTYGLAGNRDTAAEIMEVESGDADMEPEPAAGAGGAGGAGAGGAWSRVDVGNEPPPDLAAGPAAGLGAEPRLGAGVAGALQLALSKGYLERAGAAPAPRSHHLHLLAARHYSIEDKTYGGEDDKHARRERGGHAGPAVEFREKPAFRPNIKLEYVDDDGRPLCPKEAFRYLSHKFHGKGPGKNKQEKRIKKAVQEGLMKKMSSTDTPLNTLQMLQDKQRETHSPYIVLSGAKRDPNN